MAKLRNGLSFSLAVGLLVAGSAAAQPDANALDPIAEAIADRQTRKFQDPEAGWLEHADAPPELELSVQRSAAIEVGLHEEVLEIAVHTYINGVTPQCERQRAAQPELDPDGTEFVV